VVRRADPTGRGGIESAGEDATKKAQATKRLHAFESVGGEWIGRAAKHAKLALDAGVEERKVRIAEQQGELIAQVIRSILGDVGLSKAQQDQTAVQVPRSVSAEVAV
jgi:hypothetical protein